MRGFALAVVAVLLLGGCNDRTSGHGRVIVKSLSHSAVEQFIEQQLGTSVVCNQGQDVPMRRAGQTFTCTGGGRTYTVTITDPATGRYVVR